MTVFGKASVEAQIYRWLRHDWRRYVQPGSELEKFYEEIERKYRPDQARVPAGNPDGGRWTNEGRGSSSQGDRGGRLGFAGRQRPQRSARAVGCDIGQLLHARRAAGAE